MSLLGLPNPALRDPEWTPLTASIPPEGPRSISLLPFKRATCSFITPTKASTPPSSTSSAAAADDPQTVSIKMTAYRIGDDTPFVKSLIRAAERGKQVACVMEIKARFDEERNLHWAAELERAGAHVTFGVSGLKTHAKTALVVRKEASGLRCYVHIGTGNYHVKTARLYADVGLFTCDHRITDDAVNLFHYLTGHADQPDCASLLVAPLTMRPRLLDLIHREIQNKRDGTARAHRRQNEPAGRPGHDRGPVRGLAGRCTDRSHHSRILLPSSRSAGPHRKHSHSFDHWAFSGTFAHLLLRQWHGGSVAEGEYYIGSADWMFRNLSKRIEVVTPVFAAGPKQRLWEILDICLRDEREAWVLGSDAKYTQLHPEDGASGPKSIGTHQTLMNLALERADI